MKFLYYTALLTALLLTGCKGCSKSGQKKSNVRNHSRETPERASHQGKTTVKMENINGVNYIPVEINGVRMNFVFDTGASIISISQTEASFLFKQGTLTEDDIRESINFMDANGDISTGTRIILRTVKIGNKIIKNIEASVVHNTNAPLLFGQSALQNFGSISIDNRRGEITFE